MVWITLRWSYCKRTTTLSIGRQNKRDDLHHGCCLQFSGWKCFGQGLRGVDVQSQWVLETTWDIPTFCLPRITPQQVTTLYILTFVYPALPRNSQTNSVPHDTTWTTIELEWHLMCFFVDWAPVVRRTETGGRYGSGATLRNYISRQECWNIKNNERSKRIIRVNQFARFGQPHETHVLPCFAHNNFRVRPLPISHYCYDVFSEYCTFFLSHSRSENVIIFVWFE